MIRAMIHFDTNFLIQATITGSPAHEHFRNWAAAGESFGISSIAWSEYLCGPLDATARTLAHKSSQTPKHFWSRMR
jgi:predicted nucleic acid-binding protein